VELGGEWSQTEELLYCLFYIKSLQQAGELGEEEANERLGRMGQSGASILPRKTAGSFTVLTKEIRPYGLFDTTLQSNPLFKQVITSSPRTSSSPYIRLCGCIFCLLAFFLRITLHRSLSNFSWPTMRAPVLPLLPSSTKVTKVC
jgi:hypothetical protein